MKKAERKKIVATLKLQRERESSADNADYVGASQGAAAAAGATMDPAHRGVLAGGPVGRYAPAKINRNACGSSGDRSSAKESPQKPIRCSWIWKNSAGDFCFLSLFHRRPRCLFRVVFQSSRAYMTKCIS